MSMRGRGRYPGEHDAIIDHATWDRVHAILQESPRKRAARTRADTPALLKGLLYGPDGAAFSPTHTRKGDRLYRYYVSQTVLKHGAGSCLVGRVPAGEIEAAVIDQLRAVFRQPEIVAGTWKAARVHTDDISEDDAREALTGLDPLWDEFLSAISAHGTVWADCIAEGLRLILTLDGVEDDEETCDDEGPCRAGREGYPACDAQVAFVRGEDPDRAIRPSW
jgi:hypothetical protein